MSESDAILFEAEEVLENLLDAVDVLVANDAEVLDPSVLSPAEKVSGEDHQLFENDVDDPNADSYEIFDDFEDFYTTFEDYEDQSLSLQVGLSVICLIWNMVALSKT